MFNRWLYLSLLVLLIVPLLISFTPSYTQATLLYDNTYANAATGSDNYTGSSPTYTGGSNGPTKTIGAAINNTSDNGTVHVAAGTYVEKIHLDKDMHVIGAGALTTIIDGGGNGTAVTVSSVENQLNTLSGFTIRNGSASGSYCGGGIYIAPFHIVIINDCAIVDNFRGTGSDPRASTGGGICNDNGLVYMNRCTVSGNSAGLLGGGIANIKTLSEEQYGKMYLTNCTISGNTVTASSAAGGGLYNSYSADVTLLNVTIANNRALHSFSAGGGFSNASISSMYFKNCIVANNTAGLSEYNNGYDGPGNGVHSQGNNLSSDNSCYFNQPTDQVNTNPLLGALQNNGGQTSTIAITTLSPAYNRGDRSASPTTDQRGVTRPAGAFCSIGAFEPYPDTRTASATTNIGMVNFTINAGSINGLTSISTASLPCAPSGYTFPYGFFSFNISNLIPGSSVQVTIKLPNPMPTGMKYFKCQNGIPVDCSSIMTRPDPYTIVLTLVDGGTGDADGIANGTIIDPGGPSFPLSTPQSSSATMPVTAAQQPVSLSNISVKSASLSATKVAPGTPVTVTANVSNTGNGNGTSVVRVYINGSEVASRGITVNSGGSTHVSFDVARNEPGTYTVYVGGTNAGSFTVGWFADPDIILFISSALVFFAFVLGVAYIARRRQAY